MAAGEPRIRIPKSTGTSIVVIGLLIALAIAVGLGIRDGMTGEDTYRIRWNHLIPKAVVEEMVKLSPGHREWRELREFRDLPAANKFLDVHIKAAEAGKVVYNAWRVVREEK